ncbi:MAG: hypothetical protein CMP71_01215 [Flavobacteriales bacterium]|nr:hypothetical protein [Flavobacteriales bacterium]
MLLFPFFSNGSFPVQNYESQKLSVKTNNQMINQLKTEKNDYGFPFGSISLVLGLLSIPLLFVAPIVGVVFSFLGIVLGSIGLEKRGRGMAIAGLLLGSLTLLIGIIYVILFVISLLNAL